MGKRLVLVGGAGAIGQAFARNADSEGDEVVIFDLEASLRQAGLLDVDHAFPVDVTRRDSIDQAVRKLSERWDSVDGLVYLSGYSTVPPRLAVEVSDDEWNAIIDVNLTGAFRTITAVEPLLKAGEGRIVIVSSSMAFGPVKGFAPYIASKAGLIGLTRALALEFAPFVRVNAIAPSAMETPFLVGGTGLSEDDSKSDWFDATSFIDSIPMGRLAVTEDCVGAIDYLLSNKAGFVTGQVIHINGGRQMR